MPSHPVRVLLADDHAVVREGLKALVGGHPNFEVVGEAADGPSALALAEDRDPDVVVVDVSMPGMGGAEVTARLRQARAGRKVLALTVHEDPGYLRALLAAGATGYVLKRAAADELLVAIRAVAGGGLYVDPALAAEAGAPQAIEAAALSEREAEVVRLVAGGYSNKEIAAQLAVSVKTVETYKARAMEKLGVRTRVGLVRYALGQGWLTTPPAK
jgi:two-component system, NarL family, response regulator NreC